MDAYTKNALIALALLVPLVGAIAGCAYSAAILATAGAAYAARVITFFVCDRRDVCGDCA